MSKNTNKKVSISTIDNFLKEIHQEPAAIALTVGEATIQIEVKRTVSVQEFCDMVASAVENCFQVDMDGTEHFVAALRKFSMDLTLLTYLTNLKTGRDVEDPNKQNQRLYQLCTQTDLMKKLEAALDGRFLSDYRSAVLEQVEFRKQGVLSAERAKLQESINSLDGLTTALDQFNAVFAGLEPKELLDTLSKFSSLNEHAMAQAVVDLRDADFVTQSAAQLEVLK